MQLTWWREGTVAARLGWVREIREMMAHPLSFSVHKMILIDDSFEIHLQNMVFVLFAT